MPSGITCIIEREGGADVREFLLRTARLFGHCFHQREDDLANPPTKQKVDRSVAKCLEAAERHLQALQTMTLEDAAVGAREEHDRLLAGRKESNAGTLALRQKYLDMKAAVEVWVPPTPDHECVKQAALEQIEQSCPQDNDRAVPEMATPEAWLAERIEWAEQDVARCRKRLADHLESVKNQNAWVDALLDNLGRAP
jgi:hypothetical protein